MTYDVCVLLSTRPDIIKMSPVVRALDSHDVDFSILHTGQHYSYSMDDVFFDQLGLRDPDYRIPTKKDATHGEQTAHILEAVESYILDVEPRLLLVYGDTNSALAGALAARKQHFDVGHIEAGLRSDDWRMPEEHNRVVVDHISDVLFAPTDHAATNLRRDDVKGEIRVTGNTIVDVIRSVRGSDIAVLDALNLEKEGYFLVTCHREENVDSESNLHEIVEALRTLAETKRVPVVYPVHPRTRNRIDEFDLDTTGIRLVDPVSYLAFLALERNARLILTDSGGVQEEACIVGTPCVTLRESTERPETVDVGANVVAGVGLQDILVAVDRMEDVSPDWENPFGDGTAGDRIVEICLERLEGI